MKIKGKNIGIILYGIAFSILYLFVLSKSIITNHNYLANLSPKEVINHLFFIALAVGILISTIYGSYIEVKNNIIIRSEGFLKKKFLYQRIKKIYCAHHIFLGPSMFLEYQKDGSAIGKEKKLLVLNSYRDSDKKALLDFLHEKYPDIPQDHNCEQIRNGEKVLTTWKEK